MDLSPESLGMTHRQHRVAVIKAWSQECGLTEQQSCFYTMTSDENFIVDKLPHCPQVVVIAGLSGHGFKFTSVLGKIACELAMDGIAKRDIDFLRWR